MCNKFIAAREKEEEEDREKYMSKNKQQTNKQICIRLYQTDRHRPIQQNTLSNMNYYEIWKYEKQQKIIWIKQSQQ